MRRGFTALEVMLAAAVSTVVLVAALGLMAWIDRAVVRISQRAESEQELGLLHQSVRRAMQTLVVEQPDGAPARRGLAPRAGDVSTGRPDGEADPEAGGEGAPIDAAGEPVRTERPRFLLEPQIPGRTDEWSPRRLEMVLLEQPAPGAPAWAGTVRGAFELRPTPWGTHLVWQSIVPEGPPVVLAEHVEAVQWTALTKEVVAKRFEKGSLAWRSDLAASTRAEAPKALRLVLRTEAGVEVDWLFELAVTSGPQP